MKLFIADNYKLTKFNLPKEAQESFLVTYKPNNSKKEYTISIESKDGSWYLKSNGLVNAVLNGQVVLETKLEEYHTYQVEIAGDREPKFIFCFPSIEKNTIDVSVQGANNISIGNGNNCNICFQNPMVIDQHAIINVSKDGKVLLTANGPGVYVNCDLKRQVYLKIGDIIFIYGLKLIWMGQFIRVNTLEGKVFVNGFQNYTGSLSSDYTKYEKIISDEVDIEFQNNGNYFYHIPRILNGFGEEKVTIDGPPGETKEQHTPLLLSIGSSVTMAASSFMMGFSVVSGMSSGNKTVVEVLPQIIMCVAMIFGSVIMPRITTAYSNKQLKKREKLRQEKYSKYLEEKEQEINKILEKQSKILKHDFPSQQDCINLIMNADKRLWERQLNDRDFLSLSVGIGKKSANIDIQAPEKKFSLEEDGLQEKLFELVNRSKDLNDVPITYSLLQRRFSAIIFNYQIKKDYINNLILQLVAMHSATDLKLVFFVDDVVNFDYAKYLPHTWSEDKKTRFFSNNIADITSISDILENEIKMRKEELGSSNKKEVKVEEETYKKFSTYYLIITDSYKKIKDVPIINDILKNEGNIGFSILFLEDTIVDLPPQCKTFSYIIENASYIIEPGDEYSFSQEFKIPEIKNINMNIIASKLFNIPIPAKEGTLELPKSLTFLEMYKVSKIEQLNILNRWTSNDPVTNLKTPIGIHANGELFILDLHEKAHGPHGLIAGSTGSGKSEFIITFILSMAINFHPNEVQFVLIDYKGGGLAGAFENREKGICLPHLAGTITNLDTAEMNRTLVSINSELKRRQAKFNEERDRLGESTIDIYKYQRLYREGKIKDPIAHLFIISDEFAELKSQQPEFMNELISTARIGRSLGVHLILATQKPSGVVNDQIWANSKFKICLKVQDRSDSMEMLKRPEAASIKEAGRFYLQVGYDEYFDIGQSGYSGAKYIPSDRIIKKVDDSLSIINLTGQVIKTITENKPVVENNENSLGDQLTNVVKYIVDISKKQKIKINKLWLSSIPAFINLKGIEEKYDFKPEPYIISTTIGEYDNPAKQTQGLLMMDLTNVGNLIIYGMAGSGKENLLTTLIYSTCISHSPEEVNFYIFDYGAETLKIFSKYPHVGNIVTADENDSVIDILVMIDKEADRRKAMFTEYAGSYKNYLKESGNKLPLIVIIINYYEVFNEANSRLVDALSGLIREGSKYGIVFIISTSVNNAIGARMTQLFLNKISLQQSEDNVYRSLLNSPKGLYPKKHFGRGLAKVNDDFYEFQTAYICEKDNVNKLIRKTSEELNSKYKTRALSVYKIPEKVTLDMFSDDVKSLNAMPIGYSTKENEHYLYDFSETSVTPILSTDISTSQSFILSLIKLFKMLGNTQITVIDTLDIVNDISDINVVKNDFDNALVEIIKGVNRESENINRTFFILGFNKFKNSISDNYIVYLNSLMSGISKFNNSKLILFDSYDEFKNIQVEDWFDSAINLNHSIWLGPNVLNQTLLTFDKLNNDEMKESFENVAFVSQNNTNAVIKTVIDEEGDTNG